VVFLSTFVAPEKVFGHQITGSPKSGQAAIVALAVSLAVPAALAGVLVNRVRILRFLWAFVVYQVFGFSGSGARLKTPFVYHASGFSGFGLCPDAPRLPTPRMVAIDLNLRGHAARVSATVAGTRSVDLSFAFGSIGQRAHVVARSFRAAGLRTAGTAERTSSQTYMLAYPAQPCKQLLGHFSRKALEMVDSHQVWAIQGTCSCLLYPFHLNSVAVTFPYPVSA
jgi:hypothetical protein